MELALDLMVNAGLDYPISFASTRVVLTIMLYYMRYTHITIILVLHLYSAGGAVLGEYDGRIVLVGIHQGVRGDINNPFRFIQQIGDMNQPSSSATKEIILSHVEEEIQDDDDDEVSQADDADIDDELQGKSLSERVRILTARINYYRNNSVVPYFLCLNSLMCNEENKQWVKHNVVISDIIHQQSIIRILYCVYVCVLVLGRDS